MTRCSDLEGHGAFPKAFLHEHGVTSHPILEHFEVEFCCGTCRCDPWAQCSVQRFSVKAARFGAKELKRKPTEECSSFKEALNLDF